MMVMLANSPPIGGSESSTITLANRAKDLPLFVGCTVDWGSPKLIQGVPGV